MVAAGLASVDTQNGHILAIATSARYSQTKFFYPTQAHRQPGSAFKVFALMTLIHDYHGDPNDTFYDSKVLPAGWLSADPTWSVHTAEDTYQEDISTHEGDDPVRQHGVRAARGGHRLEQARCDGARNGDHITARRQSNT